MQADDGSKPDAKRELRLLSGVQGLFSGELVSS